MKITFIFPRFKYESGDPPLGIAYLASYVRKFSDASIDILDTTFDHSFNSIHDYLSQNKPDIVGIYLDTIMYNDALRIIQDVKKQGIFVVAGGPHATILPESLIQSVDIVIRGEAEKPFLKIISHFHLKRFENINNTWYKNGNKVIKNRSKYEYTDLDGFPFPSRDLLYMEKYIERCHQFDSLNPRLRATTTIVSRGCPFSCSFCQPTLKRMFGNNVRIRSPDNVITEIKELKRRYNIDAVFFHDDTLTANMTWMTKFCDQLRKANLNIILGCNTRADTIHNNLLKTMFDAGFRELHIGIESASQRILDNIYKKGIRIDKVKPIIKTIRTMGFNTMCFFMIGAPTETKHEIKETIRFACSLPTNEISVSITNPIPETDLYQIMLNKHYHMSKNYDDFDYYSGKGFYSSHKKELSYKELKKLQMLFLGRFYSNPKRWIYIWKHLSSRGGIKKMFIKLRRFV